MSDLEKAAKEMLLCVDRMLRDGEWYAAQEKADALRAALEQVEPNRIEVMRRAHDALEWHYSQGHSNTLGGFRLKIDQKILRDLKATLSQQAEQVSTEPIATVYRDADRQQIEFHTYVPEGETIRLYAMPPLEPVASLMTNIQSDDVELVWNDDGFNKTLWRETVLYKIGGSDGRP
jgi:hypothetical protein